MTDTCVAGARIPATIYIYFCFKWGKWNFCEFPKFAEIIHGRTWPQRELMAGLFALHSLSWLTQKKEKKKWAVHQEMGACVRARKRSLAVAMNVPCYCCSTLAFGGFWARKPRIRPPRPGSGAPRSPDGDDDRIRGLIWRSLAGTSSSLLFCGFVFGRGTALAALCVGFGYS
jgi:hypothetical protein